MRGADTPIGAPWSSHRRRTRGGGRTRLAGRRAGGLARHRHCQTGAQAWAGKPAACSTHVSPAAAHGRAPRKDRTSGDYERAPPQTGRREGRNPGCLGDWRRGAPDGREHGRGGGRTTREELSGVAVRLGLASLRSPFAPPASFCGVPSLHGFCIPTPNTPRRHLRAEHPSATRAFPLLCVEGGVGGC